MRLSDFKVLTFDTYGTLIDWEAGLLAALESLIAGLAEPVPAERLLETFATAESARQKLTPDMRYSDLLAEVYRSLAGELGVAPNELNAKAFGGSVGDWPAFADSAASLAYLKEQFTLVTLTNCDRDSYRGSDQQLGHPFDAIYTAQDIGSYKPAQRNFDFLIERVEATFGQPRSAILHVAQSLFHDHVPATRAGLATAWIDRRAAAEGFGATAPPEGDVRIDFRFATMDELVTAHQQETAQAVASGNGSSR